MKKQKIKTIDKYGNLKNLFFAGGYISGYTTYSDSDRTYDSMKLALENEVIDIMVFHNTFNNVKSPLPELLYDAFTSHTPIACVYNDNGSAKTMIHVYTNFTSTSSETKVNNDFNLTLQEKSKLPF